MNHLEVIGLGALNIDHIYQVERIIEDGETDVKDLASFPGGSAANTIYGLARRGISTSFIGAVGDDAEGKLLRRELKKAGVDAAQVRVKLGVKTGSTLCIGDELGRRSIYVLPGANNLLTINAAKLAWQIILMNFILKMSTWLLFFLLSNVKISLILSIIRSPSCVGAPMVTSAFVDSLVTAS